MTREYDKRKVRRAMLVAPLFGMLGLLPLVAQLNLTAGQFTGVLVAAVIVSYVAGFLLGAPGYLILKWLGRLESPYIYAYAALLVVLIPLLLNDLYAVITFGPPTVIGAITFCYLRGEPVVPQAAGAPS